MFGAVVSTEYNIDLTISTDMRELRSEVRGGERLWMNLREALEKSSEGLDESR